MAAATECPPITEGDRERARMFGLGLPQPAPAPADTPTPPAGRCSLTLRINGTPYRVAPIRPDGFAALKAFRVAGPGGTRFDVSGGLAGPACTCGRTDCEHARAARAVGLID